MPGFSFAEVGRLGFTSPPYRSGDMIPDHCYYDPLRLPITRLVRFARRSATDTLYPCSYFVQPPIGDFAFRSKDEQRMTPGILVNR
jgi:hypothetical protein